MPSLILYFPAQHEDPPFAGKCDGGLGTYGARQAVSPQEAQVIFSAALVIFCGGYVGELVFVQDMLLDRFLYNSQKLILLKRFDQIVRDALLHERSGALNIWMACHDHDRNGRKL